MGRKIAAVELHPFDDVEFGLDGLSLLDSDDTLIADALHGFCNHLADGRIAVGRDRADLRNLFRRGDLLGAGLDVADRFSHREIDAALQVHRVHAGRHRLGALAHDRLGENRRGGGAVTGDVAGFRGHLAHHLGAHVHEPVVELDFLGDGDAVLGDARRAIGLFDHHVAALGAERDLHGVSKDVDAAEHLVSRVGAKSHDFRSHDVKSPIQLKQDGIRRVRPPSPSNGGLDHAHDVGFLHDQEILAVDLDLGAGPLAEEDAIADLDVDGNELPALVAGAGADGNDHALLRFFLGGVGDDDAASSFSSASTAARRHGHARGETSWLNPIFEKKRLKASISTPARRVPTKDAAPFGHPLACFQAECNVRGCGGKTIQRLCQGSRRGRQPRCRRPARAAGWGCRRTIVPLRHRLFTRETLSQPKAVSVFLRRARAIVKPE